jgi:hypothetical protein
MRRVLAVAAGAVVVASLIGAPAGASGQRAASTGQLTAAKAISLHLPAHDQLVVAEAADGTVFYAPHPVVGEMGGLSGVAAAKVIRVVDGAKPEQVAEHAPGPVLALAAGKSSLYAVTSTQVVKYDRSTGKLTHTWSLSSTSTYAAATLTPDWLYVTSAAESDFAGFQYATLTAINTRTHHTHTVSTKVFPGSVAAKGGHVYYGGSLGHLVKTTPTAKKNHHTAASPKIALNTVGFFGGKILTWGSAPNGTDSDLYLVNPSTMDVFFRSIPSAGAFDIVEAPTPIYSNSTCPQQIPASKCHSATFGELGNQISRQSLTSGALTDSVSVPQVDFLIGPKPAAITTKDGVYRLVRIQ